MSAMRLVVAAVLAIAHARRPSSVTSFDRDAFSFDPSGRILQLDYADVAAGRGALAVGVATAEICVVCGAQEGPSTEKVALIDERHAASFAGLRADGAALVDVARGRAATERLRSPSEAPPTRTLALAVADECYDKARGGGDRAYGCRFLVAGLGGLAPGDARGPCLWSVGPGGDARRHASGLVALGAGSHAAATALAGAPAARPLGAIAAIAAAVLASDGPRRAAAVVALAPDGAAGASGAARVWRATLRAGDLVLDGAGSPALSEAVGAAAGAALGLPPGGGEDPPPAGATHKGAT